MGILAWLVGTGVALLLMAAGAFHALPGPTLKMQEKDMRLPGWFIMCAGALMFGSGLFFFLFGGCLGLCLVSLCIGGTSATGAILPDVNARPGALAFSALTLLAAFWSEGAGIVALVFLYAPFAAAGVAGVLVLPKRPEVAPLADFVKQIEVAATPKVELCIAKAKPHVEPLIEQGKAWALQQLEKVKEMAGVAKEVPAAPKSEGKDAKEASAGAGATQRRRAESPKPQPKEGTS